MKAKEIVGEGVLGGIGKVLQKVGGKMVDKSAASAEKAAAKAATKSASEPGVLGKAANAVAWPIKNPVKATALGVAGATVHNKLNDPSMSWGKAIGQGIKDTGNFLGDIYTGATGDESPMKTVQRNVDALPDPDQPEEETPGVRDDGDYVSKIRQRSAERFDDWPTPQNEDIKKKFNEFKQPDLDKELEKQFPDPNVRKAIIAKIGRESGGANVGELSYRNTSNRRIREKLPQLKNLSDVELNALKQDDKKFFDRAYSKIGGYQYRGRGPLQITGKSNYDLLDKQLGLNGKLSKDPDLLLNDPTISRAATVQYLKNAGLDKYKAQDQRDAYQRVIAAVGGAAYAPGTSLGKSELAAIERGVNTGTGSTTVASAKPISGAGAKPSEPITKAKINKPYYTASGPGPEETLAKTDRELAARRAAVQRISTGPGPEETLAQTDKELAARRAATAAQKNATPAEPVNIAPTVPQTTGDPFRAPEPSTKPEEKPPTPIASKEMPKNDSGWDKFINTVTVGRVPPEEKERIRVPESINKEIQDILRLAGKR